MSFRMVEASITDAKMTQRRGEILDAALKIFAEKGYRDAGIADIAAELKLGHGTFYRYFKNKRDIFQSVVVQVSERLAAALAAERPDAATTLHDYRAQVRRWGYRLLEVIQNDPRIARIILQEALAVDEAMRESVNRMWDFCAGLTEAYLVNGKRRGFLRPDLDTRITSMALNAIIFEAMRRGVGQSGSPESLAAWIEAIEKLMFDGIRA